MAASSPLLPFRARSYVIFATGDNTAWALDALAGSNGAPLWQVHDLPISPAAPALVTNTSAWWAGAPSSFGSGWLGVWRMDLALGSSPKTTPLTEGGSCAADAFVAVLAPLAALPVGLLGGATVGLVTARGCVVAVRADTSEVWRLDLAPPGGGDVATLAVDADTARGFVLTDTGALCCVGGVAAQRWLAKSRGGRVRLGSSAADDAGDDHGGADGDRISR